MDANSIADLVCSNHDVLVTALTYMGGIMPVVSIVTWVTAKWGKLPSWAQSILQVAAGNVLHAALGEPIKKEVPPQN